MTFPAERLLQEALRLSDAERGEIAAKLFESLELAQHMDAESAWAAELRQRLDDFEQGRVKAVTWPEARRQILEDGDAAST